MAIFDKYLFPFLMITSIWLTILILGFAYFYECDCESISTDVVIKTDDMYPVLIVKLRDLNVGDYFTKDSLATFMCEGKTTVIWIDILSQDIDSSYYEIKGGKNGDTEVTTIQWRYYIKTKRDTITSIVKGK
jgi:hypothetical protein